LLKRVKRRLLHQSVSLACCFIGLFAYGQTGSGKTFSMMGSGRGAGRGIIPRLMETLFFFIQRAEDPSSFKVDASFLEICKRTSRYVNSEGTLNANDHFARPRRQRRYIRPSQSRPACIPCCGADFSSAAN
jgi:hypothetical protein